MSGPVFDRMRDWLDEQPESLLGYEMGKPRLTLIIDVDVLAHRLITSGLVAPPASGEEPQHDTGLRERVEDLLALGPESWGPLPSRDAGEVFSADSVLEFVAEVRAALAEPTQDDPDEASPFVTISAALDSKRADTVSDGEHLWRRITKVCEESGEVWRALSGMVGENPRKGQTHTRDDLLGELLDTAAAALCGWAHLHCNVVDPIPALLTHVEATAERLRAALAEPTPGTPS